MPRYAFFDVDNTIYNGYTINDFIPLALKEKVFSSRIWKYVRKSIKKYLTQEISYAELSDITLGSFAKTIKGFTPSEVTKLAKKVLSQKNKMFFKWAKPTFEYLKNQNYKTILVSAGPEPMIREISKIIKADKYLATTFKIKNGRYTGEVENLLDGDNKVAKINKILKKNKNTLTIGFGDSTGDIPMLEMMDHVFVFETDHHPDMMKIAKKKGWKIFNESKDVINYLKKLN